MIDLEDVQRSITAETRILVASYVQFATGFRQDLVSTGRLCRDRKLIFVVDATQGMGVFPIDVVASGIDFLVFSGYKWAQAGYGVGGLYIAPEFLNTSSFRLQVGGASAIPRPSAASSGPRRRTAWRMRQVPRLFPYGRRYGRDLR